MRIEHQKKSNDLHIKLIGEFDERISEFVRTSIDRLIEDTSIKRVYFDLSELSFMDSTGVGVLIGRYKKLKPRGISIYLVSPTSTVDRVLKLSGIYEIMIKAG